MIQSFRDLSVWQKSMELTVRVYTITDQFPPGERFGLTSQMRRAAASIPSNIAEGKAIGGLNYPRQLRIAHGSEAELHTQIELARRLKLLSDTDADDLSARASEIGRMLVGLVRALPKQ